MLIREPEVVEKPHQVEETPVDASEDLHWGTNSHQTGLAAHHSARLLAQPHHLLPLEREQLGCTALHLRTQSAQRLNDGICKLERAKVVEMLFLLGCSQFLTLF